jgi:Pyridoxal-phosphate dependent enzyme
MAMSLAHGRRVTLSKVDAFADGVAVKQVGAETFRLAQQLVDGVVLIDSGATSAAIKDVFNETRSILEPAGALSVAGAKAYLRTHPDVKVVGPARQTDKGLNTLIRLSPFWLLCFARPRRPESFDLEVRLLSDGELFRIKNCFFVGTKEAIHRRPSNACATALILLQLPAGAVSVEAQ